MRSLNWFVALTATVFASKAFCGGLFAPFSMESTSVLPKGVKSVGLGGFTTEVADRYNGFSQIEIVGNGFNKAVTWGELIDSTPAGPNGFDRGHFKGGLEAMGVNMDEIAGYTRGLINTRVTSTIPSLAYGVTDRLTVGVGVPIFYSNVNIATGWSADPAFQAKLDELARNGYLNKVMSYEDQLMNVIATKMANYGYKPLESSEATEMGDTTLLAKYQAYKEGPLAVAVVPRVVIPTGRKADPDKLVDIAPGDGQWDLGVTAIASFAPTAKVTLVSAAGYTYQAPSQKAVRIPLSRTDDLTPDVDRDTREKQGDLMSGFLGASYAVHRLWTVNTGYALGYRATDEYSGSAYASERYSWLSDETDQVMHAAQIGLGFSTVPLFTAKQFDIPFDASISFASVFAGRNVNKVNLTSVALAAYF